jgi:hypothetical protein
MEQLRAGRIVAIIPSIFPPANTPRNRGICRVFAIFTPQETSQISLEWSVRIGWYRIWHIPHEKTYGTLGIIVAVTLTFSERKSFDRKPVIAHQDEMILLFRFDAVVLHCDSMSSAPQNIFVCVPLLTYKPELNRKRLLCQT